jgi:hypothetical protein
MAQQPIDYSINAPEAYKSVLSGFQTGLNINDLQLQQQAKELELQRRQELQKRVTSLIDNPNATAKDYTSVAMLLPEKEAESVRKNFELLSKDEQQKQLLFGGQVMAAFNSNKPEIGVQLLRDRATAERNSGREDQAKQFETLAQMTELDPAAGKTLVGIRMGAIPGGDKFLESSIKVQKAPLEIRDIESKIDERTKRLDLDKDKLQSEVEIKVAELSGKGQKLDADARKIVNEATIASVAGEQSAGRMLDLAQRIQSADGGKGVATKASEWFAKTTGRQDEFTQMRQEYIRVRNSQAIKSLPPGVATDKDITLAMQGFPDENSNAATLSSFLRGMAKMQQYEATSKSAESEWVNATGSLGRARNDILIGDIQVPAGTTFTDFMRQFGDKRAQDLGVQQGKANVGTRSYMKYANPQGK